MNAGKSGGEKKKIDKKPALMKPGVEILGFLKRATKTKQTQYYCYIFHMALLKAYDLIS